MRAASLALALAMIGTPMVSLACVSADYPKGRTVKMVAFPKAPTAPFFYVRTFDYNYAIVFDQRVVTQLLGSGAVYGGEALLKDPQAEAPLAGNVDLSGLILRKQEHFSAVQHLSVVGLERALASVVLLPEGTDVLKVKMLVENRTEGYTIRFDANGNLIAWVVRCIAN